MLGESAPENLLTNIIKHYFIHLVYTQKAQSKTFKMSKEEMGTDEIISRHQKWATYTTPSSLQMQQVSQKSSRFQLSETKGEHSDQSFQCSVPES